MPVSVGSEVTPLKCGEICDMDFVANFMEKYDSENCENGQFVKPMNECIVAQFLLRHGVVQHVKIVSGVVKIIMQLVTCVIS